MAVHAGDVADRLRDGLAIPAHPLALDDRGRLDEPHQRALSRYYLDAGAGGLAVGVHTTQYGIHSGPLYEAVLRLAAETSRDWTTRPVVLVAGICGPTEAAVSEAETARGLGYSAGLLSVHDLQDLSEQQLLDRARAVGEVLPVIGFYIQQAVGGRPLSADYWRGLADLDSVVAVKVAPFDRYRTLDVVRGLAMSRRGNRVALYTGNDDSIVADLVTPLRAQVGGIVAERQMVGGLLGQWAVGTRCATTLLSRAHESARSGSVDRDLLALGSALTDLNAAVFDVLHDFAGCIAGINEVLHRLGLVSSGRCLAAGDRLSTGQAEQIAAAMAAYPDLVDTDFVADNLGRWLAA